MKHDRKHFSQLFFVLGDRDTNMFETVLIVSGYDDHKVRKFQENL